MTTPGRHVFVCPVGGCLIEGIEPHELPAPTLPEGTTPPKTPEEGIRILAEAKMAQIMEAEEAILLNHMTMAHTAKEMLEALGAARNALQEIDALFNRYVSPSPAAVARIINRGLGGK